MQKVIAIGSAVKDVFLVSKGFKLIKSKDFSTGYGECFTYGGKVELANVYFDTGGGATNACATFRNLGIDCGIYTKVGMDYAGKEVFEDLKKRGVKMGSFTWDKKQGTGYSTILLSPQGDRTILVYRGASQNFDPKDLINGNLIAKWFYLTATAGKMDFIKKVFAIAKNNKTKVFWNPGSAEIKHGMARIQNYLNHTDVLSVNKEEARDLTGKGQVKDQLNMLNKLVPTVIITDGKIGAYIGVEGRQYFAPALGTPALNTTGAGDAFGSAFLSGLIQKDDWQYAIKLAILNSDGVIQEMGAKHGLLAKIPNAKQLSRVKINKY